MHSQTWTGTCWDHKGFILEKVTWRHLKIHPKSDGNSCNPSWSKADTIRQVLMLKVWNYKLRRICFDLIFWLLSLVFGSRIVFDKLVVSWLNSLFFSGGRRFELCGFFVARSFEINSQFVIVVVEIIILVASSVVWTLYGFFFLGLLFLLEIKTNVFSLFVGLLMNAFITLICSCYWARQPNWYSWVIRRVKDGILQYLFEQYLGCYRVILIITGLVWIPKP